MVTTAMFLRDETHVVSLATTTHGLTRNLPKQLPEAPSKSHPKPVWWDLTQPGLVAFLCRTGKLVLRVMDAAQGVS